MYSKINCELQAKPHSWTEEEVPGDYLFYGIGIMKQRRCICCQVIEYIEFTSEDGYVTEIKQSIDQEFEDLCKELENKE